MLQQIIGQISNRENIHIHPLLFSGYINTTANEINDDWKKNEV